MSGFTIPNTPDASNQNQAEPDSLDFQIIGNQKNGIVNGLAVSPGSGATVAVGNGEVLINGVHYTFGGVSSLNLTTYASTNFFDVVYARVSGGVVTCYVAPGTGGLGNPRYPSSGSGAGEINFDTDVVLAVIWRTGAVAPTTAQITDKRVFVRSNASRTNADTISSNRGSTGDIFVNGAWSSSSNLSSPLSVKVGTTWYNLARYSADFTAGTITASLFSGPLSGNVTGNLTGNVTGSISGGTLNGTIGSVSGTIIGASGYLTPNVNIDPLGGPYIGWSTVSGLWAVEGGFRVTSSNFYATGIGTTTSSANMRVLADGRIAYNTSLRKYKEQINDVSNALETINALRPRTFKAKPTSSDSAIDRYIYENSVIHGFIVEEVLEANQDLIDYGMVDDKITPQMWRTNDVIALLTKAVQELSVRIDALEAQ